MSDDRNQVDPKWASAEIDRLRADARLKPAIANELYKAIESLGAKSDLLQIIGSYGDTQPDSWVLDSLREYNADKE